MTVLRSAIAREVTAAGQIGQPYDEILSDLSTNLAWLIAAGSTDRTARRDRVRKALTIIAAVLDAPPPAGRT